MSMNVDEGYRIARKIKRKIKDANSPEQICAAIGIELVWCDLGNMKGMYSSADRHRTVYLNEILQDYRDHMYQTLFHEIGHDQIREHRLMARNSPLADYYFDTVSQTERQANTIAAHVLLEDDKVIESLKAGSVLERAAQEFHVHEDLLILKLEEMKKKMGKDFPFDLARLPRNADPCFLKRNNGMAHEYN